MLLIGAVLLAGIAAFAQQNPFTSAEDEAAGGRIFRSHCAECHGIAGEGGRGPNLTTGELRHGSSDAALLRTISRGVPGTEMPGVYFSDHQVWQVVAYVRSLSRQPKRASLAGDPAAGEKIYSGKGGCTACHMVRGSGGRLGPDLTYIGSMRTPEHLKQSLLDPQVVVPLAYRQARVVLKEGQPVVGLRLNEDTYSIQILDGQEKLRSLDKSGIREILIEKTSSMPSYASQLSAREVDDVVAWLSSLRRKAVSE